MVLVDTSVWVDHFRVDNNELADRLNTGQVLCHRFVIGELACGNLRKRDEILNLLGALPQARVAQHSEVLHFMNEHRLHGRGLGWIDLHLLASALLTRCHVWTLDKPLRTAANAFKIAI